MDDQRFDQFARRLAGVAGRREALRRLGAVAAAALSSRGVAAGVAAREAAGIGCRCDADCADPDADPCTGARCEDGSCVVFSVLCAPGFVCCGNGECCEADSPAEGGGGGGGADGRARRRGRGRRRKLGQRR